MGFSRGTLESAFGYFCQTAKVTRRRHNKVKNTLKIKKMLYLQFVRWDSRYIAIPPLFFIYYISAVARASTSSVDTKIFNRFFVEHIYLRKVNHYKYYNLDEPSIVTFY